MVETLIYVKSAATLLCCTEKHVYDMIKDPETGIEAVRLGPKGIRVVKESVIKYIKDNKINTDDYYE